MENPRDIRNLLESFDRALGEASPEWPEEVKGTGQFPGDRHPDHDDWGDDDDEMPRGPMDEGDKDSRGNADRVASYLDRESSAGVEWKDAVAKASELFKLPHGAIEDLYDLSVHAPHKPAYTTHGGADVEESTFRKAVREGDEDVREAVDELREIQEKLFDVIESLDAAIRNYLPSKHANLEAYLLAPLKIRAGSDQYMSNDPSIEKVIEMVIEEHGEGQEYDMEEGVDDLEGMQQRSKGAGDEIARLQDKLGKIRDRVNSPSDGYDDRSMRGVKRVPRYRR